MDHNRFLLISITSHWTSLLLISSNFLHINRIKFIQQKNIINDWFFIKYFINPFYLFIYNILLSFIFTFTIKNQNLLYIIILNFILKIILGFLFFNINNSKNIYKKVCWTCLLSLRKAIHLLKFFFRKIILLYNIRKNIKNYQIYFRIGSIYLILVLTEK